ncbi:hypothetical protein T440DRAFT_555817 [Plenodomus tracheiphilus IPT5]|uniref:C2H2-type domain-containing protein n=1 Tax=Plenodomus tracheiphilus IPT5 TaxID=1408161 RepID=A0A6A7B4Z3_9PLEO|nr:hypothetical protein T440DRAFT_555817 [Plenodomus tracheiphilus IPT5]
MLAASLHSQENLLYNAEYGVIICRDCSYAIQRSALSSHLLRHKIYRTKRQHLLETFGKLALCEPEDVQAPLPNAPPIEGLTVIDGLKCTISGCGKLCASEKRMRRHRSECHGSPATECNMEHWENVKMQTFFRGTKIRYFEVNISVSKDRSSNINLNLAQPGTDRNIRENQGRDSKRLKSRSVQRPLLPSPPTVTPLDLNMEILSYLHHYTTLTSPTLPNPSPTYWNTEAITLALQHRWLMCGLLTLSAYHLSTLADNEATKHTHNTRASQLYNEFITGKQDLDEMETPGSVTSEDNTNEATNIRTLSQQIALLLNLTRWPPQSPPTTPKPNSLHNLLKLIHELSQQSSQTTSEPNRNVTSTPKTPTPTPPSPSPSDFIKRLRTLPPRIGKTLGRPPPTMMDQALTSISAISMLVDCILPLAPDPPAHSPATSDPTPENLWRAMSSFTCEVLEEFYGFLERGDVVPVIVAAHWVVLVRWARDVGFWVLSGALEDVEREMRGWVEGEGKDVKGLVEGVLI